MKIGIDIGSTTLKCVVLDKDEIIFKSYERHFSEIAVKTAALLSTIAEKLNITEAEVCISGSAGMGLAERAEAPFIQEVYATRCAVLHNKLDVDAVIELGGEDAKIIFLKEANGEDGIEVRMNGSCAGGTGAFIDQMASLLKVTPDQMDVLAQGSDKLYTIASRCGVFAKSDIQPLINQGARTENIAASIFYAVVNQTIAGLAQGREIKGNVLYLGGPLTYFSMLRSAFDDQLKLKGIHPENSLYYVALGTALSPAAQSFNLGELHDKILFCSLSGGYPSCPPLFENKEDYMLFTARHSSATVVCNAPYDSNKDYYLGIDAGSTTVKAVVCDQYGNIIYSSYKPNSGNPVPLVLDALKDVYSRFDGIRIAASATTGYGEELIQNAFCFDFGVVETIAHYKAAKRFLPEVDFILDIGGQDIKCISIRGDAIDNLYLNEACSSGCGSFLQTFAGALGYDVNQFGKLGLFAKKPVDLGSRCTVFMNSSVKQSQKDGASVENISAGLSISVVKNAIYKVIRAANADSLGKHIVVQGGTFYNDAVLRAFEQELNREVIRPSIAGLMGAYGAALYAHEKQTKASSSLIKADKLDAFKHSVKAITCKGCPNGCRLTVNMFDGERRYIGGNRCEKPVLGKKSDASLNIYQFIRNRLESYGDVDGDVVIGLPLGLNMYELLPFWHTFFTSLGFGVRVTPFSSRKLYLSGQSTMPSDTICFPAKLLHGHIDYLINEGVTNVFYPCMSYNFDENLGDNHYNCPVVAYYPEVLYANVPQLKSIKFVYNYFGLHKPKFFKKKFYEMLTELFSDRKIEKSKVYAAADKAYAEYYKYLSDVRERAAKIINEARAQNKKIIVLAGRPYHVDTEINHGIDELICSLGAAVINEEALSHLENKFKTNVLNQWTYHSRLYAAAKHTLTMPDANLVQLVSFGCGLDAVTADETRLILESGGKLYTQIKIDEITNLGAVKIRLRSLFEADEDMHRSKKH